MVYNKPAITIEQQLNRLKERGLVVENDNTAAYFLRNVSYYRLAGYWWPMLQDGDGERHQFKENSTFENVIAIYNFDRELRNLVFDIIERIEIGIRTKLTYHLSHEVSPWWFEDANNFVNRRHFEKTLESIDRDLQQSSERFISEHYIKYHTDQRRPPAWKTLEVVTLGTLSKMYGNLKPRIRSKDAIARELGTANQTYLPSWLLTITQIRNICAHHARLWNKNLPGRPRLLPNPPNEWLEDVPSEDEFPKLYVHLCCMKYLMNVINPGNHFTQKLDELFKKYPNIDPNALGMKTDWQNESLWTK
jgi:abortive infection bacteriophage resistance protein